MHLVLGQDRDVAAWVAARIPHMGAGADFGPCAAIGVVDAAGRPLGGVVFSSFLPACRSIEVSIAADRARWLTAPLIRGIMSYPFVQLGCQRVTAITPRRAAPTRRFLDRFGFKREGVLRKGFGTDDAIIHGLLEREWRASRWNRGRV
jgi:RimJ/RimL family protein N-acetyltransferase